MADWTCPHGYGPTMARGDCAACEAELAARPEPSAMTGDERAAEVHALLHDPSAYLFDNLHKRLEGLVGRPVWTHEFITDLALQEEARSWDHPADLNANAIRTLEAVADGKPIVVIRTDR